MRPQRRLSAWPFAAFDKAVTLRYASPPHKIPKQQPNTTRGFKQPSLASRSRRNNGQSSFTGSRSTTGAWTAIRPRFSKLSSLRTEETMLSSRERGSCRKATRTRRNSRPSSFGWTHPKQQTSSSSRKRWSSTEDSKSSNSTFPITSESSVIGAKDSNTSLRTAQATYDVDTVLRHTIPESVLTSQPRQEREHRRSARTAPETIGPTTQRAEPCNATWNCARSRSR